MIVEFGLNNVSDECKSEFPALLEAQAVLLCAVVSSNVRKNVQKAHRLTSKMWSSSDNIVTPYVKIFQNLKETSQFSVVLGSYLIGHLVDYGKDELINNLKVRTYDFFLLVTSSFSVCLSFFDL